MSKLKIDMLPLCMIPIEEFKEILKKGNLAVDDSVLEVFRDLVDTQADLILDSWEQQKQK